MQLGFCAGVGLAPLRWLAAEVCMRAAQESGLGSLS